MLSANYLNRLVLPLMKKYDGQPNDNDLALAIATLLEHTADHIKLDTGRSLNDIRKSIEARYPDYKYLRAVAISTKHAIADTIPGLEGQKNPLVEIQNIPRPIRTSGGTLRSGSGGVVMTNAGITSTFVFIDGKEIPVKKLLHASCVAISEEVKSASK